MAGSQLKKLGALAGRKADISASASRKQQDTLSLLDKQGDELSRIHHEYQTSVVGRREIAPQLLAHRRAFVDRLSAKLESVEQQRIQQKRGAEASATEHRQHETQRTAINRLIKQQQLQIDQATQKQEATQQNEVAQNLRHVQMNRRNEDV